MPVDDRVLSVLFCTGNSARSIIAKVVLNRLGLTTRRMKPARSGRASRMTAHWGVPDPAKAPGTEAEVAMAFADAFPDDECAYLGIHEPAD